MAAANPEEHQDAHEPAEAGPTEAEAEQADDEETTGQQPLPHVDQSATSEHRAPAGSELSDDIYRIKLDVFEGPLDLLLQLIRKHELDILDIPISFITEKYLQYLDVMRSLHIDVTSEYLVMAATLTHIKSKMLLPADSTEDGDEGIVDEMDPRADLVRRLLEYQKYKHAAAGLGGRPRLGRDVFPRGSKEPTPEGAPGLAPVNVFKLFDAFERVLKQANQVADHHVLFERVSIAERIVELTELLHDNRRMRFEDLFTAKGSLDSATRLELVVTFLALLEMCKMRVARITQQSPLGELEVEFSAKRLDGDAEPPPPPTDDTEVAPVAGRLAVDAEPSPALTDDETEEPTAPPTVATAEDSRPDGSDVEPTNGSESEREQDGEKAP